MDKIGTGVDFFDQFPHAHPLRRLNPEDHDSVGLNGSGFNILGAKKTQEVLQMIAPARSER